jgi:hypothetical protein
MRLPDLRRLISLLAARRQRPREEKPGEQVESKAGRGTPAVPVHRECRSQERVAFMGSCPYEISDLISDESIAIHQGEAVSMNISAGGMLLFMDQAPPVEQVFLLRVPESKIVKSPTLVEVCWTRAVPIEDYGKRYLVGVKFLSGLPSNPKERGVEQRA